MWSSINHVDRFSDIWPRSLCWLFYKIRLMQNTSLPLPCPHALWMALTLCVFWKGWHVHVISGKMIGWTRANSELSQNTGQDIILLLLLSACKCANCYTTKLILTETTWHETTYRYVKIVLKCDKSLQKTHNIMLDKSVLVLNG